MIMAMKKGVIFGSIAAFTVVLAAVAYAALSGDLTGVLVATGTATGSGTPCQTSAVDFEFGAPDWSSVQNEFVFTGMTYSGVDAACVTNGAILSWAIVDSQSHQTVQSGEVNPVGGASAQINFVALVPADSVANYDVQYAVTG